MLDLLKSKKSKTSPEVTDPNWALSRVRAGVVALHFAMDEYAKGGVDDVEIRQQVRDIRERLLDITRIYRAYEKKYAEHAHKMDARLNSRQISLQAHKQKAAFHVKIW